jgi:D-alanyl-D-alanine carboxypeptidase/D-alanyl-D-alanine-endopeptidase (penicillin-binding protein 4)
LTGRVAVAWSALLVLLVSFVATVPAHAQSAPNGTVPVAPLTVPLLSARRVPDLLRDSIGARDLTTRLNAIVAQAPEASCLVISDHGRTFYDSKGGVPVEPASVNKLLTAFSVVHNVDPNEKVPTLVKSVSPPTGGVIDGDLHLVGGGDGILSTGGYKQTFLYRDQPVTGFADLADRIKAAGITEVRGGIVGDDSRYDQVRYLPAWPQRFQRQDDVAPLSALEVNDGVTGYQDDPDGVARTRKPGDPPSLAAATLKALLVERGITVVGPASAGVAPEGGSEVARIESTILAQVHEMLGWSDNTTAELLGKELGLRRKGAGTATNGIAVTAETLARFQIPTTGVDLRDSSGLDEANRLTCHTLNAVLDHEGPDSAIAQGLPVAGRTGTLQRRMRGSVAEGNLYAKTGSLETPPVASLAGFMRTTQGGVVTFSFVQNGKDTSLLLLDEMAKVLADFPVAPDLSDLAPHASG